MDPNLREALRRAVVASAPVVLAQARTRRVAVMRGSSIGPENRIDLDFGYVHVRGARLDELDAFEEELTKHYPRLPGLALGGGVVGTSPFHARDVVSAILRAFGARDQSLAFAPDVFDECVRAFDTFAARPMVRLRTVAPVLGLDYCGVDDIPLAGSRLHMLTDDDRTDLLQKGALDDMDAFLVKCAIIFEREEVADRVPHRNLSLDEDRQAIDRALRALRTFKSGSVIVRQLHQAVTGFWPGIPLATGMILDRALVTAPWAIGVDEAAELALHAERLASDIEPSLELACSRLADAETRTLPRDALLDAAIGLEAILLHERSAEHRYKGEMRYRFAMHYAALAPPRERRAAFHLARDLYDARSAVAHGSTEEGFRMGDCKDASMASVAGTAKAMLRDVIMRFLPTASRPAYTSEAYWPDLLLGPRDQP